jgi:hypothetical protein
MPALSDRVLSGFDRKEFLLFCCRAEVVLTPHLTVLVCLLFPCNTSLKSSSSSLNLYDISTYHVYLCSHFNLFPDTRPLSPRPLQSLLINTLRHLSNHIQKAVRTSLYQSVLQWWLDLYKYPHGRKYSAANYPRVLHTLKGQ